MPFNTSNRLYNSIPLMKNCSEPFPNGYFQVVPGSATSLGRGFITFNSTVSANITALNNTEYWTPFSDGTKGHLKSVLMILTLR